VLTDEEADAIRRKLAEGWRGPVLLTWLQQLLQDREERRQMEREERDKQRGRPEPPPVRSGGKPCHALPCPMAGRGNVRCLAASEATPRGECSIKPGRQRRGT
jgi:hypothetical protein